MAKIPRPASNNSQSALIGGTASLDTASLDTESLDTESLDTATLDGTDQENVGTSGTADGSGWVKPPRASRYPALTDIRTTVQTATADLMPAFRPTSPSILLKSLGDGHVTIDVPMRPGDYKFHGIPFTVKPGTVAHVQAQVKNGDLVAFGPDQSGTRVVIDPPLDLPLWVTGDGVELKGEPAHQQFEADLGGFFNLSFDAKKLNELASSGDARLPEKQRADLTKKLPGLSPLALALVDLSSVQLDATVNLRDRDLDLGGARLKVNPATTFSLKSDGTHATLTGHVQLDHMWLDQGGVRMFTNGGGTADLRAQVDRTSDGYRLNSVVDHLNVSLDVLDSRHESAVSPGTFNHLSLGPSEVHDGTITVGAKLGIDGLRVSASQPTVAMDLKGSGVVNELSMTVRDDKDTTHADFSGDYTGSVHLGPDGLALDAKLTKAHVGLRDLQQTLNANVISVEHALARGDFDVVAKSGQVQVDGYATNLDVVVDDFQNDKIDMGRTTVAGEGELHVGAKGLQAKGHFVTDANIDSVEFGKGKGAGQLGASHLSGDLTDLNFGQGAPSFRAVGVDASLRVEDTRFNTGATSVQGGGAVKGKGDVSFDATGFTLDGSSQLSFALDAGRLHTTTADLRFAEGSGAELKLRELRIGKDSRIRLAPGTDIHALLEGGTVKVAGQQLHLDKGGQAEFKVKSANLTTSSTDVRGSLKVDAPLHARLDGLAVKGVKVHPTDATGRVKLSIDDVQLSGNTLSLAGADASVDLRVGRYTGVKVPGQPGVGALRDPVPTLSKDEVAKTSATTMANVPPVTGPANPVEALRLLRDGQVTASVPLTGSIPVLGVNVVKFRPGAGVTLSFVVEGGKINLDKTSVALQNVKAMGLKVVGAQINDKQHLVLDVSIMGKVVSVPVPGWQAPTTTEELADSFSSRKKHPKGDNGGFVAQHVDVQNAHLDVSNAVFSRGQVEVPGGTIDLAEGARLSLHGTPLAGQLSGVVGLEGVTLGRDTVALRGGPGRGEVSMSWQRTGGWLEVSGSIKNLAAEVSDLAQKSPNGDYVQLGAGKVSGGTIAFSGLAQLDANGLPAKVAPKVQQVDLNIGHFVGDLKSARRTTKQGFAELGPSHVEGSVGYSNAGGLTLKGKVAHVDAHVSGTRTQRSGRRLDVEDARLVGEAGTVDFGPDKIAIDARGLAWDATVRNLPVPGIGKNQVHITGEGRFNYDSTTELKLEGQLHIDAHDEPGATASVITLNRRVGLKKKP